MAVVCTNIGEGFERFAGRHRIQYGQIIATGYKTVDYIDFGKLFSIGGNRSELPSL